jgi:hypothetical protein
MLSKTREKRIRKNILEVGKRYIPAVLPEDLRKGLMGHCFDNCALQAFECKGKYSYVEGFVETTQHGWILHAWLTDGVHAFDVTWSADRDGKPTPIPFTYIGVEMDHTTVATFMIKTGYAGVLANGWRAQKLALEAIERAHRAFAG